MTKEQAAEIILGEAWENCRDCGGWAPPVSGNPGCEVTKRRRQQFIRCETCNVSGKAVKKEYREACLLLNLPIPILSGSEEAFEHAMKRFAGEHDE